MPKQTNDDTVDNMVHSEAETVNLNANMSRIGLREIMKLVPKFNGKNMSLGSFLRACNDARQLLNGPMEEKFFLIYVRSRIIGDADAYLSVKCYSNWSEFSAILKQIYGSKESISQLQLELSNVFQKSEESVAEYGKRVNKIVHKMIDMVRSEYNATSAESIIELIQNNALISFIRGLNDEIETRVITQNPRDLKHAVDVALIAEKEISEKARIRKFRYSLENGK